jgi:hypothetical protein
MIVRPPAHRPGDPPTDRSTNRRTDRGAERGAKHTILRPAAAGTPRRPLGAAWGPALRRFRRRVRPIFGTTLAVVALLAGVTLLLAPSLLAGGAWPPLHARCMGAFALSLAASLLMARRESDPAALRLPLVAFTCWSTTTASALLMHGVVSVEWPGVLVGLGALSMLLAKIDDDPPAPAQHADRHWRTVAGMALLVGVPLLARPGTMSLVWPWNLKVALVAQYAPMFLSWGLAIWLMARERRRYVRLPVMGGVMVWAGSVFLASLWHRAAFTSGRVAGVLWFVAFAVTVGLAASQLFRPRGRWR